LSLGEIMILLIVGIVVVGPKNLPTLMRTAGQWIGKLRRMSTDLRSQSGIDELIRQEGLEREIHELRSLSRMNVVDSLISPALTVAASPRPLASPALDGAPASRTLDSPEWKPTEPLREREYPLLGCDAGGALADDAVLYTPDTPDAPTEPSDEVPIEPSAEAPEESAPLTPEPAADLAPLPAALDPQERPPA
jgi:sec-independent protein translocase protein TatB